MTEIHQVPIPAATVTLLDIYRQQIEMGSQLAVINEKLADLPDHEARLRVLEAGRAKLAGACAVLGVLAGGGAGWVAILLAGHH